MPAKGNDNVGTASVDIVANIIVDEASLAEAEAKISAGLQKDAQPRGGRGRVASQGRDATPITQNVDAKVKAAVTNNVAKDIQTAIDRDEYKLTIDTGSIREQIQRALQAPFKITIDADIKGAMGAGFDAQHGAAVATGGAQTGRGPIPDELTKPLQKFGDTIDNLHEALSVAYSEIGRTFGRGGAFTTSAERAADILGHFGATKVSDLLQVKGRQTSGPLSVSGLTKEGISADIAQSIQAFGSQFITATTEGQSPTRMADDFFAKLNRWMQSSPVATQQAPTSAGEIRSVLQAVRTAVKETADAMPVEELKKAVDAGNLERARHITAVPFDPTKVAGAGSGLLPGARQLRQTDDIDADRRALQQLGISRGNARARSQRVPVTDVAGLNINMEPFLRAASMGAFRNIFEVFGGKKGNESRGLTELQGDEIGEERLTEIRKRRGRQVIAGLDETGVRKSMGIGDDERIKFESLNSREALIRSVIASQGVGAGKGAGDQSAVIEAVRGFLASPEVSQQIAVALTRGSSPVRGTSGATKRGQGAASIIGSQDLGGEAKRLFASLDWIDGQIQNYSTTLDRVNSDIERLAGSGQKTSGLEEQAQDLAKQVRRLGIQREGLRGELAQTYAVPPPEELRALMATQMAGGAANRARVAGGVGKDIRQRAEERFNAPGQYGARISGRIAAEELPPPHVLIGELINRFFDSSDLTRGGSGQGTGQTLTGVQRLREAAYGPGGTSRKPTGGLYGEFGAPLMEKGVGRTEKKEGLDYIKSVLQGVIGDESFRRELAEEAAKAKEQMGSPRQLRAGDVARGLTGEGQYTTLPPGTLGKLRAQIEYEQSLGAGHGTHETHQELEGPSGLLRRLEEVEQRSALQGPLDIAAQQARLKTSGRGRYTTGDETTQFARDQGAMVGVEGETRYGSLIGRYRAQRQAFGDAGGAYGGGGGDGGGGGGKGSWNFPIPLPVLVVNDAPITVNIAGEGGGGGRGPRGRVDPYDIAYAKDMSEAPFSSRQSGRDVRPPPQAKSIRYNRRGVPIIDMVGGGIGARANEKAYTAYPDEQPEGSRSYREASGSMSPAEMDFLAALQKANPSQQTEEGRIRRAARMNARGGALTAETANDEERERYLTRQEERVRRESRRARRYDPESLIEEENKYQQEFQDVAGQARIASRSIPRRGFGASLTDLITGGISGKIGQPLEKQLAAQGRIDVELADLRESLKGRAESRREVTVAQDLLKNIPDKTSERYKVVADRLDLANKAVQGFSKGIVNSTSLIDEQIGIIKKNRGGAFGAAAIGGIASTAVGSLTFALANVITTPLLQATGEVITKSIDKLLGNIEEINAGRAGLGEATRGAAGRAEVGVGQVLGAAGLAGATFRDVAPVLNRTAAIEAGNKALTEQLNLLRLVEDSQRRGADAGTTTTLGGLFGTPIGGTAPATESIADFLGGSGVRRQFKGAIEPLVGSRAPGLAGSRIGADAIVGDLDKFHQRLGEVNQFLDKTGPALVHFADATNFSRDALNKQARDLDLAGAPQLAALVRSGTTAITDRQGGLAQGGDIIQSISDALAQAAKPSLEAAMAAARPGFQLQRDVADAQRRLTMDQLSAQEGMGLANQGFGGSGAGTPSARDGIDLTGLSPREQRSMNKELDTTQKLYDQINHEVDLGTQKAKDFVSNTFSNDPSVGQDFAKSLDAAAGYAKQISSIQIGLQTKQAAFSAAQFSYQIDVARRSLKDAKGLISGVGDSLGAVERQQYDLQRKSQALTLGQSQRQINFQTAVAGFTAPGLTGEERAARITQAKLEAEYAQKQLNIQKQLFGLQGKQFTITASRNVRDLVRQIGLLERGRSLTLETAAAEKKIRVLTILAEREQKKAQVAYDAALQYSADLIGQGAALASATGKALREVGRDVLREFGDTYNGMIEIITRGLGGATVHDPPKGRHALGAVGMVNGETNFGSIGVAGEAGGEAYAILRDPRKLMTPMGSPAAAAVIQVIVQGNHFNSQEDEDRIMRKITDAVERAQGRKAALLGVGR